MKQGYNLEFKLYLEGIETPFKSANVVTTPGGTVASINLLSNKEILDLKPKTQVQIFFKDWFYTNQNDMGWRLMFDGYTSKPYKIDQASQGRTITLECRDFRSDIRKMPAAVAYDTTDLGVNFNVMGIYRNTIVKGNDKKRTETYGTTSLSTLPMMLRRIAGSAAGKGGGEQMSEFAKLRDLYEEKGSGKSKINGFILDAIARGLWNDAVNGTVQARFFNKRIRADKKIIIPFNESGTRFWKAQATGLEIGRALMGGAKFTSIEAMILRAAGIFSARPYACSTPSLISLKDRIGNDEDNPILDYIIHPTVKDYLIDKNSDNFGPKYTLNECMILPPLEFTAPPNCNVWFPSMYDRVEMNFDIDQDITRGIFQQIDTFDNTVNIGDSIGHKVYTVPAGILGAMDSRDEHQRRKLKLTEEERYKGVNIHQSTVEFDLGMRDIGIAYRDTAFGDKLYVESKKRIQELTQKKLNKTRSSVGDDAISAISDKITKAKKKAEEINTLGKGDDKSYAYALRRHSLIKYINVKFSNRVATCTGNFNPYQIAGFPGVIVASPNSGLSAKANKTMIGTVQQVKHIISISTSGFEAATTTVLNNARYIDEPTDINIDGLPLYEKDTVPEESQINKKTLNYEFEPFFIPESKPRGKVIADSKNNDNYKYDLVLQDGHEEYKYVKDFVSLSEDQYKQGGRNTIYIDQQYEPNRIGKFYKYLLGESHDHFMLGRSGEINYIYNTIHEAVDKNLESHPANDDYEVAMKFVKRNIVSADEFFKLILQATTKVVEKQDDGTNKDLFVNGEDTINRIAIYPEYYGVTNEKFEEVKDDLQDKDNKLMMGPGDCSSINEHVPITSFIKERKIAVRNYLNSIKKYGDAID